MLSNFIRFFLENKLITLLLLLLAVGWGFATAPFDWEIGLLPRDPVAVDAIPDIGENQQIVFTEWAGRSPQDIDDQITYPLTTALMGISGIKTVRANSMLGFSSIYLIFEEDVEFYWSRSRILEKLNSLPAGLLPEGVQPSLGPDATALGQIFWYTLEGRDAEGKPAGGWDLHELRALQDFQVRYALSSAKGVSEVASIGGFVKEYQIDVDPSALVSYQVSLAEVGAAVQQTNLDVGARTLEINQVEYLIRGIGQMESIQDLEETVVKIQGNTPVRIKDIARVSLGPADRRGILDKAGAEAVGGVVVARYGENPLAVIKAVKEKIAEVAAGLPAKELADGRISKVTVVPFYDRTRLIKETLGTLNEALKLEIIITILVVILMVANFRASLLISCLLPISVLMTFIAMRYTGVDANIVALSGIAIAIGTVVDVGIILTENIIRHLKEAGKKSVVKEVVFTATREVAPAVITAVMTTIISFIPVFTLQAAEGKLFRPLAFTKTYILVAAILIALIVIPAFAHWLFSLTWKFQKPHFGTGCRLVQRASLRRTRVGTDRQAVPRKASSSMQKTARPPWIATLKMILIAIPVLILLAWMWLPLGPNKGILLNSFFVAGLVGGILGVFYLIIRYYSLILSWCLKYKIVFLSIPSILLVWGGMIWFGMGREFMPALDEGSFLLMPSSMPHAGIAQNKEILRRLDMAVTAIPEVEVVVGKAGRVNSSLDPAPLSMYENVINYKSEYKTDENGNRLRFRMKRGKYERDQNGELIPDRNGQYFRQWRDHIHSPKDIWDEIARVTQFPGVTPAPPLQPIETRLIMLQTGMRAPFGVKVKGPDLETIETFSAEIEAALRKVKGVKKEAVVTEQIIGKPYLNLVIDRKKISRYGLSVAALQRTLQMAIGGMVMNTTVEGRERFAVRVRYARAYRDNLDALSEVLVATPSGQQIPMGELVTIEYEQGPQVIKSENTFLVGYVFFDKEAGVAETDVVLAAKKYLVNKIESGRLVVPAGVSYSFAGNYENQVRLENRLSVVVPICLILIFLILYLQFKSIATTFMVFSGIAVAFAGGFMMLGIYAPDINLSAAVWVGFIALFGIATDDGVLIASYLDQVFEKKKPKTKKEIRAAVIEAGSKRVRPALMTTATTLLALLPILGSSGRGADVMIPMAVPIFGGMTIAVVTIFVVPVLYGWRRELRITNGE